MSDVLQGFLKAVGVSAARAVNPYGNGRYVIAVKTLVAVDKLSQDGFP